MIERISTKGMARREWLERRRHSIGGSDAAAIVGLNRWSTPYMVWADKTGKLLEKPDNEAMRQGRDLEQYVAERFMEATGKRVRQEHAILYNPLYPFAHADIDRWVIGENAGLECKTTSVLNLRQFKNGDYPAHYYVQCIHYMAVTGAERWYVGVLIFQQGFYVFEIERDETEIQTLMEQEAAFWNLVKADTPPPVDGAPMTTETLTGLYSEGKKDICELFGRGALLREYQKLKGERKVLERRMEEIKQTVMEEMQECETGVCGPFTVYWNTQKRRSFDSKRFLTEHPEWENSAYWKSSRYRTFEVKESQL